MKFTASCFVLLLCAALTACGGGGSDELALGEKLAAAPRSVADPSLCAASTSGYSVVEGQCQKLFTGLNSASPQPVAKALQSTDALPQLAGVSRTDFFGWAQTFFPAWFGGTYVESSIAVGYDTFFFRYYYASGNYLGVLNGYVYIYGPLTGWVVAPVASLDYFYCAIYGCAPTRTFITWTGNANGVVVKDANNESFAFYSDSRCLYSYAREQETTNFCLSAGRADGYFAGVYVQVMAATSTTGGCIAVLADWYGRQVDIYTNSAGIQIVSPQSGYWQTYGCS